MLATTVAGIGFGMTVGFVIAFAWSEMRVVEGESRHIVQFEVGEYAEGAMDFPFDLVPHRVVGKSRYGDPILECDAVDFGWRLGLLYGMEGAVIGAALACGAKVSKVVATGLITAIVFSVLIYPFLEMPFVQSRELPIVAMNVFMALLAACGEAVSSARPRTRIRQTVDE